MQAPRKVFARVEVRNVRRPDAARDVAVRDVVEGRRIAARLHQFLPDAAGESRLFQEFALGSREGRGIRLLDHAGWNLPADAADTVPVLAHEDDAPVLRHGNDVHPVRVLEDEVFGDDVSVGQFDGILPHRQPRLREDVS